MSRSHSKIRHMQESNLVLEQRRLSQLSESMVSQSTISTAAKKSKDCINKDRCPNLLRVCEGSMKTAFGMILMYSGIAGELFSFGLSTVASVFVTGSGMAKTALGMKDLYNANWRELEKELISVSRCLGLPGCYSEEGCSM